MPETHMLKPYRNRVMSIYHFMKSMIVFVTSNATSIMETKANTEESVANQSDFDLSWSMDMTRKEKLMFKGYEAKYKPSEIHGNDRLYYDHNAPFEKEIDYYLYYQSDLSVKKPQAYIIPQNWGKVIQRLESNGIIGEALKNDTSLEVTYYYIEDLSTVNNPYEGHYLHSKVQIRKEKQLAHFRKGDMLFECNQKGNAYLVHVLEPQAADSFFAWNFF